MGEVQYLTKSDLLYENLKSEILDGKLRPGERLIVADIAKKYDVSPMPVRESLRRLQQEGLIEMTPHIGAKVTAVDMREFSEILEVRMELESAAARLTAERSDPALVEELNALLVKMREAVTTNDSKAFGVLNQSFHNLIYNHCGNDFLCGLIDELWGKTERTKGIFGRYPERMAVSLKEHGEIVKYIESGDVEKADEAFRLHKRRGFEMVKRSLEDEE